MPHDLRTTTPIADLARELTGRITALLDEGDADWSAPSPCDGWTAGDVLDHVVDTERDLLQRHDVTLAELPVGDRRERWTTHAAQVVGALRDPAVTDLAFDGFFGPTTLGDTFRDFYAFDLVVHRWDLARAFGTTTTFSDEELDLVERALALFGEHITMEGICAPAVDVPADASRRARVLAATGRTPDVAG